MRVEENIKTGSLAVSMKDVGDKTLKEATNVF